ncbi:MAG: hypothetical protein AAFV49_00835 [Pseudomonadota bacterium]
MVRVRVTIGCFASAVKAPGGTGQVHGRAVSAAVLPFGVDICSGLTRNGALDPGLPEAFVTAVSGGEDGR